MTQAIQNAAEDITLLATLKRIKRKADIMALDRPRGAYSALETDLQILARIALSRVENDGGQAPLSMCEDGALQAKLKRIKRKADIMEMDAPRNSAAEHDALELQLLVGIALRCIGGEK